MHTFATWWPPGTLNIVGVIKMHWGTCIFGLGGGLYPYEIDWYRKIKKKGFKRHIKGDFVGTRVARVNNHKC